MTHNFFDKTSPNGGVVEAEVWRASNQKMYNRWGDIDESVPEPPIPTLAGRTMVGSDIAVVEPRTTRIGTKSGQTDGVTTTAITLYFRDAELDIRPGDMIAFIGHNGKYEAWKLEGEPSTNMYVSPFTGIMGGREVFLVRNREMK